MRLITKIKKRKENHDRITIIWTDPPLTKEQRRNFKKEHPGKRLSFMMRFPDAPLWIAGAGCALGTISVLVALWRL